MQKLYLEQQVRQKEEQDAALERSKLRQMEIKLQEVQRLKDKHKEEVKSLREEVQNSREEPEEEVQRLRDHVRNLCLSSEVLKAEQHELVSKLKAQEELSEALQRQVELLQEQLKHQMSEPICEDIREDNSPEKVREPQKKPSLWRRFKKFITPRCLRQNKRTQGL